MAISRASLVVGPAKVTHDSATHFSKEDITINLEADTFPIETSAHGKIDERVVNVKAEVSFTPEGRWDAAAIAALWPYRNTGVGTSIYGGTDKPLVASANDGAVHTIIAAAITKMPSLEFSAKKTLIGAATWTGVRQIAKTWSDADSLYTIGTGGTITDATFAASLIKTQPYTAAWGSVTGFTALESEDGFSVEFDTQFSDIEIDSVGTIDKRFKSLAVMVKCKPIGPTSAQILANLNLMSVSGGRGSSLAAGGHDLTITGADGINYCIVAGAALKTAGYRFGSTVLRQGEIGFVATRSFTSGAQNALFTLAAS